MKTVDLSLINEDNRWEALFWISDVHGLSGDKWNLQELRYIIFTHDEDATMFCLRWL